MRRGYQRRGNSGHSRGRGRGGSFEIHRPETKCGPETLALFTEFAKELDEKHDKMERVVKLSRDLTSESKRVIFLLHRATQNRHKIFEEAEWRLAELRQQILAQIAKELQTEDPNRFYRAFSPGIQEFLEAITFLEFLKNSRIPSIAECQKEFEFKVEESEKESELKVEESAKESKGKVEMLRVPISLSDFCRNSINKKSFHGIRQYYNKIILSNYNKESYQEIKCNKMQ